MKISLRDVPDLDEEDVRGPMFLFNKNVEEPSRQTLDQAVAAVRQKLASLNMAWVLNCQVRVKTIKTNVAGQYDPRADLVDLDPKFDDEFHTVAHEAGHRFAAKCVDPSGLAREIATRFAAHAASDKVSDYGSTAPAEFWAEAFSACMEKSASAALATWVKTMVAKYNR